VGFWDRIHPALEPFLKVLTADDGHDFNRITLDAVVNTVNAAHAAPVSFPNIVNGWIQKGLFGNLLKPVKKGVVILVGLRFAILAKPAPVDAAQVFLGIFAQSIGRHPAALLP
jgi:hypothetical protein